jgi:hypothetical protein
MGDNARFCKGATVKKITSLADAADLGQGSKVQEKYMDVLLKAGEWEGVQDAWDLWAGAGGVRMGRDDSYVDSAMGKGGHEGIGRAEKAVRAMFAAEDAEMDRQRAAICDLRGVKRRTRRRKVHRPEEMPSGLDEW